MGFPFVKVKIKKTQIFKHNNIIYESYTSFIFWKHSKEAVIVLSKQNVQLFIKMTIEIIHQTKLGKTAKSF